MERSLYCKHCRVRLTQLLTIVSGKDPSVQPPKIEMQKPIVAVGVAFKSWKPMHWISCAWEHGLGFAPQFWLNPGDLTESVQQSGDRRSIGCCGPMGLDGPNMECRRCKARVGTLQADCVTPFVFIPDPKTTSWVEGAEEYWDFQ